MRTAGLCNIHTVCRFLDCLHTVTLCSCGAGMEYGDMHAVPNYKHLARQPRNDGLWLIDIPTKEAKLLISIQELSHQLHRGPMSTAKDPLTALPYNTTTGSGKACPASA